jgi:hypothetical protein
MERTRRGLVSAVAALSLVPSATLAAPLLRAADARIAFLSPVSCRVELSVTIEGASQVEHRVEVADGARVTLLAVDGGTHDGPKTIGRTHAIVVQPNADLYTLRYTVDQPSSRAERCPLWVPAVPADGHSASVRIGVRIPDGATAVGTMPQFTWEGQEGTTRIGHLPAFVRVPYAMAGSPRPWNVAAVMDTVSVLTLVVASLLWARRRRRTPAVA